MRFIASARAVAASASFPSFALFFAFATIVSLAPPLAAQDVCWQENGGTTLNDGFFQGPGDGITAVRLMTNNPRKVDALEELGVKVVERLPLHTDSNPHNEKYLQTKAGKLGHMFGGD